MHSLLKKTTALLMALTLVIGSVLWMGSKLDTTYASTGDNKWNGKSPKYIFLFIGDGMTYPQFTATADYLGSLKNENKIVDDEPLKFMTFPVNGTATTFDASSFCPDSASTATSISTGFKTKSGVINMNPQKNISYEAISETLKKEKQFKVGVVTSVPLNHATPAAFYAHQPSRGNYYEIGEELIRSDFDYFAGGGLLDPKGKNNDKPALTDMAKVSGYKVVQTREDILALTAKDKKIIAMNETLVGGALPYEIDRESSDLSLADFTRKGIEVLQNPNGFFLMVEGGKIDWACHANDASASIHDTIAFDNAVKEAVKFYEKYPDETLIIVTGDHETGGLTMGYAGTKYSTYLDIIEHQTLSAEAYDLIVENYRKNQTSFDGVVKDLEKYFGLLTATHKTAADRPNSVLTDEELSQLKTAYEASVKETHSLSKNTFFLEYGGYEPLSVAVTHLLNNKSGIGWTSYSHTGLPVAVFALGTGSELFRGYYDNTDLYFKMKSLSGIK